MYICQICKKVPATIHLTDIHNNVKKEVHICESCAAEKGFNLQGAANLPQLLGLAAKKAIPNVVQAASLKVKGDKDLICLHSGSTRSAFGERGRLGCPHDYQTFDTKLRPLIANQIAAGQREGTSFHVGKKPGPSRAKDERGRQVRTLTKKLRAAVAEENYEAAARLKVDLDKLRDETQPSEPGADAQAGQE
ncbi:MAG: UvrB/UvrC motif-containing protein [Planctomycetaceae bacterium]|nr:UvrB/UvrC motif-containing protein [Planctomycetaceae bacterium]